MHGSAHIHQTVLDMRSFTNHRARCSSSTKNKTKTTPYAIGKGFHQH